MSKLDHEHFGQLKLLEKINWCTTRVENQSTSIHIHVSQDGIQLYLYKGCSCLNHKVRMLCKSRKQATSNGVCKILPPKYYLISNIIDCHTVARNEAFKKAMEQHILSTLQVKIGNIRNEL